MSAERPAGPLTLDKLPMKLLTHSAPLCFAAIFLAVSYMALATAALCR